MKKPVPEKRKSILKYNDIIKYIENKYKIKTRDYKGHFDYSRYAPYNYLSTYWAANNGYKEYIYCLDKPKDSKTDWPKESFEMQKRIEIHTHPDYEAWQKSEEEKYPYCDFWHWFIDRIEIHNGCEAYIDFDKSSLSEDEVWIGEILDLIKVEFGKYANGEDLSVYVSW